MNKEDNGEDKEDERKTGSSHSLHEHRCPGGPKWSQLHKKLDHWTSGPGPVTEVHSKYRLLAKDQEKAI